MKELAKSLANHGFQAQVRQSLKHVPSFRLDVDLPEIMLDKLRELDRVVAEREARKA